MASVGYVVLPGTGGLCSIAELGLDVAPIALRSNASDARARQLAMHCGVNRISILHRPCHPSSASAGRAYSAALYAEHAGHFVMDVEDLDDFPEPPATADMVRALPQENTYRSNTADANSVCCIDGALIPASLATSLRVEALAPVSGTQHRPVAIEFGVCPSFLQLHR